MDAFGFETRTRGEIRCQTERVQEGVIWRFEAYSFQVLLSSNVYTKFNRMSSCKWKTKGVECYNNNEYQ